MARTAILAVRIVSDADTRGFAQAEETTGRFEKNMARLGPAATAAFGAVAAGGFLAARAAMKALYCSSLMGQFR